VSLSFSAFWTPLLISVILILSEELQAFPYVNGGLFRQSEKSEVEIPNFTPEMNSLLVEEVSRDTDWAQISPTIFGGVFESTLN
ncbi:type IIL restriction-modification enzyme MmeI, partial [Bacteroides thetaiotaomicron]|uniref:type IIL restriction-modification enzyme MmeI n=1 Tax=Bacteroides thetaiotaomicron TaxID=818 RepID=UPI001A933067